MIKFENTVVSGWEAAIRGCRNPMNSWDKSDSSGCKDHYECSECPGYNICEDWEWRHDQYFIGPNDMKMMKHLVRAGTDEAKFMRYIDVTVDITAPLYWWKEFDTYKIGTVANSCSTMHKIHAKEFTLEDFSHEHLFDYEIDLLKNIITQLNKNRKSYISVKEDKISEYEFIPKRYWWQMIQLLPSSYNQRRTVKLNYQVLRAMYFARRNHKLDEWCDGLCEWIKTLPYSELITMNGKYEDLVIDHANLKKNYDELKKEYHELELKCNELQEKADMYDEHMARCANGRVFDALVATDVKCAELYEANKYLNEECDRLRDMLAELDYENRDLKNHISELYDEHILKGADKEFGDI